MRTLWTRETRNFSVTLSCEPDNDCDLSWDETGETRDKLQSGEWTCYAFTVTVHGPDGEELGVDYLGGSIHADPREFIDHRECGRCKRELAAKGDKARRGSYFSDMVAGACREARKVWNAPRPAIRLRTVKG